MDAIAEDHGYITAKSKDGKAALLGRMGKRDDGKLCVEIVVRAEIENNRRLYDMMRSHISTAETDGEH